MTDNDVYDVARKGTYGDTLIDGAVEETHISWVILSKTHAFKIKKPVRLPFLDFSTLELRREQCEREVQLNRRFSEIYLGTEPISLVNGRWIIGDEGQGKVVDYCVVMQRMEASKQLDKLLASGNLDESSVARLAAKIAAVHDNAERVFTPFDLQEARETFNDIRAVREGIAKAIGARYVDLIDRSMKFSDGFLDRHSHRLQQRIDLGLKRDVHGDLHARNIFLYDPPVLFDCIEFDDRFRQIDVLYEVAFICMDFERFGHKDRADVFLREYASQFPAFQSEEDHPIFTYFKSLRANIRAKVHAWRLGQAGNAAEESDQVREIRKYLDMMDEYVSSLRSIHIGEYPGSS